MTAPRFAACRCTHAKADHDALAPQCSAHHCTCLRYVPATAPAAVTKATQAADRFPKGVTPAVTPAVGIVKATTPTAPSPGPALTFEQIVAAGKRSDLKRTVQLADRIVDLVADLYDRVTEERDTADARRRDQEVKEAARREVDELKAKLAVAQAKLRGAAPAARASVPAVKTATDHPCSRPGCDRAFASSQGRALHERRAHDGFDPSAAKAG